MKIIHIVFLSFLLSLSLNAQTLGKSKSVPTKPTTTDLMQSVKTVEGITAKMLELISGPQGQQRNWEDFRSLFLPSVQFISLNPKARPGDQARALNLEEFIRLIGPLYAKEGFYEEPLDISVNEFNGMANAFQSYTARNTSGTYKARGINNFILIHLDDRWWIASCTWTNEDDTHKLPDNLSQVNTISQTKTKDSNNSGKLGGVKKGKIILKK